MSTEKIPFGSFRLKQKDTKKLKYIRKLIDNFL